VKPKGTAAKKWNAESLALAEHLLRSILREEVQQRLSADGMPALPPGIDAHNIEPFLATLTTNLETRDETREFFLHLLAEHRDKMNKIAVLASSTTAEAAEIVNEAAEMLNEGKTVDEIVATTFGGNIVTSLRYEYMLDLIKKGNTPREAVAAMLKRDHHPKQKELRKLLPSAVSAEKRRQANEMKIAVPVIPIMAPRYFCTRSEARTPVASS
jgi:hypothetical protein